MANTDYLLTKQTTESIWRIKGGVNMAKLYFTLTGTKYYYGNDFLKPKMSINLVKEPENEYDKEAIRVEFPGLGKIGYVANSPYTVLGESMSAGRIYDLCKKKAVGKIEIVTPQGIICSLDKKQK